MNLIFDVILFNQLNEIPMITLGIAVVNALLPMQSINKRLIGIPQVKPAFQQYEIARLKFHTVLNIVHNNLQKKLV